MLSNIISDHKTNFIYRNNIIEIHNADFLFNVTYIIFNRSH